MPDESPANKESSVINKKWLRIIIVVAIGIPVLLELSTLFNLVKVQYWGKDETTMRKNQTAEEVREYISGDTLISEPPILLRDMRIGVSPGEWEFRLVLAASRDPQSEIEVLIDSLELNSGTKLQGRGSTEWSYRDESEIYELVTRWEIPNGDIPRNLFLSAIKETESDSDSSGIMSRKLRLGPIPVRYRSGAGDEK